MIYNSIEELVGSTPLVELHNIEKNHGLNALLLAKLEYFNPAGSSKDRVAVNMIADMEKSGRIRPGAVIIEPTSGNTGIGLAAIAAAKGYRVILTMPDTMSVERIKLIRAYGAEVVLTDGALGMSGAIARANELASEIEGSVIAGQFDNPANPEAHYKTTGPEIWKDTDGKADYFVAGVGTGGTISGTGKYLKEQNPSVTIVGVEPDTSAVLSGGKAGAHKLQGIGAGFVPENYDASVTDMIMTCTADDAYSAVREIAASEGILVGVSSGAALSAAIELASRPENSGKVIVALLPDTGMRYLSTEGLF